MTDNTTQATPDKAKPPDGTLGIGRPGLHILERFFEREHITLRFNEFRQDIDYQWHGPRTARPDYHPDVWYPLTTAIVAHWRLVAVENYFTLMGKDQVPTRVEFPESTIFGNILSVSQHLKINPVADWLDDLPEWDGRPRIDMVLIDLFDATINGRNDGIYFDALRTASKSIYIDIVRRIRYPGCAVPHMVILIGPQGSGKSRYVAKLPPHEDWRNESTPVGADPKVVIEDMRSALVLECAELAGIQNRDIENLKSFVTRTQDTARPAYARRSETVKRNWLAIGTANEGYGGTIPPDETGNRRWWPVDVKAIKSGAEINAYMDANREQLFAEAVARIHEGEEILHLPAETFKALAAGAEMHERGIPEHMIFAEWATNMYAGKGERPHEMSELWEAYMIQRGATSDGAQDRIRQQSIDFVIRNGRSLSAALKRYGWTTTGRAKRARRYIAPEVTS